MIMHNKLIVSSLLLTAFALPITVLAGTSNDVPSCYAANKLPSPAQAERELFVLVDQTTTFDAKLQANIRENLGRLIKPGVAFVIADFSSFGQGKYAEIVSAGTLEPQIEESERGDISVKLLRNFDACMQGQKQYGLKSAANALNKALGGSSADLAKSDVLASLKDFSGRVKQSSAKDKVVLIASDMLENSSISSFYAKQAVRQVVVEKELKLATDNQMLGDFGGAKVYVIGAGLLAEDAKQTKGIYRSPQIMQALNGFWKAWFQKSNAELVEFGQPALLSPVK
jgi:hypothetical protein